MDGRTKTGSKTVSAASLEAAKLTAVRLIGQRCNGAWYVLRITGVSRNCNYPKVQG